MANFNKVILMGNLTRDPVQKFLPSGSSVCEFGLAVNRTWTDQNSGEKREAATFVDCKAMGKTADLINNYFKKGKQIFVEGRLEYRAWEKDGQKRSKLEVFVEGFQFVGARPQDGGAPGERSQGQPAMSRPGRNATAGGDQHGGGMGESPSDGDSYGGGESEANDGVPF